MDGDAAHFFVQQFALASVKTGANFEVELSQAVSNRPPAVDGACGAVERREKPVAGRVDLLAAKPRELAPDLGMVLLKELAPGTVTEVSRSRRRADDVREEDRRKHAIGLRLPLLLLDHLGEEGFELRDQLIRVAETRTDIAA